jgi:hypothetical protein
MNLPVSHKIIRKSRLWALRVIPLVFLAFVVRGSPAYRACVDEEPSQQPGHQQEKGAASFIVAIREILVRRWGCGGRFIDANYEGITAASGVAVAVFTLTLWRSTEKLWKAGERQIGVAQAAANAALKSAEVAEKSLTEHERPWIFRDKVHVGWRHTPGVGMNDWMVHLCWKNVGRAPAMIDRCEFRIADVATLPPNPDYTNMAVLGLPDVLAQNAECETQAVGPGGGGMKDGVAIEFVFFGRLLYREMNGKKHQSGFALRMAPMGAYAMVYENDAYNRYD